MIISRDLIRNNNNNRKREPLFIATIINFGDDFGVMCHYLSSSLSILDSKTGTSKNCRRYALYPKSYRNCQRKSLIVVNLFTTGSQASVQGFFVKPILACMKASDVNLNHVNHFYTIHLCSKCRARHIMVFFVSHECCFLCMDIKNHFTWISVK